MSMLNQFAEELVKEAYRYYVVEGNYKKHFESEKLAHLVVGHAAASTVAAIAGGVLPGAAAVISIAISVGAIWHMYYRIGNYLEISWSKELLKAIASALITNIITQLGGLLALGVVMEFVPGLSIIAAAFMNFAVVYVAGIIYFAALTKIFKAGANPNRLSSDDIRKQFDKAAKDVDVKTAFKEGRAEVKRMHKDGTLDDIGSEYNIDDE